MTYPEVLKTFSLLILDMHTIYKKMSLKKFLTIFPAQYCIILNATHQDIKSIKNIYRVATPVIHSPRSCVVLSYRKEISYAVHPAHADWDTVDNNPCLHIQIQGVNLLLAYLNPHNSKQRESLLQKLEKGHFINEYGVKQDIHLLIAYLDIEKAIEPDLLTLRYRWQYVEADDNSASFMVSSFHILVNIEIKNIQYPETVDTLESKQYRIPPSAGIITHIPCLPGWEIEHLNICSQIHHFPNTIS